MLNCTQSRQQLVLLPLLEEPERSALLQKLCQCEDCQAALAQATVFNKRLEAQREQFQALRYSRPLPAALAQTVTPKQETHWLLAPLPSAAFATALLMMVLVGNLLLVDNTPKSLRLLDGPALSWMDKPKFRAFQQSSKLEPFALPQWQPVPRKRPTTYGVYRRLFERDSAV